MPLIIDLGLLPVAGDVREYLRSLGQDPEILAATGGEDYELLVATPEEVVEALVKESEVPITVIGEVVGEEVVFVRNGEPIENLAGWDHFAGA